MDTLASEIAKLLDAKQIDYTYQDGYICVTLPVGFGEMLLGELPDGDNIIALRGHGWHTHGDLLTPAYGDTIPLAMVGFLESIFDGTLEMVEMKSSDGEITKVIMYPGESAEQNGVVYYPK